MQYTTVLTFILFSSQLDFAYDHLIGIVSPPMKCILKGTEQMKGTCVRPLHGLLFGLKFKIMNLFFPSVTILDKTNQQQSLNMQATLCKWSSFVAYCHQLGT